MISAITKIQRIFLLTLLLLPTIAQAATSLVTPLKNKPGTGLVNFLAVGRPSMLKIHGTAPGPVGDLRLEGTQLKGMVQFDLEKLDTGIKLRTQHMQEKYLEVKKYPQAKLTLLDAPVDPAFAKSLSHSGEKPFKGNLALHGKENGVNGTYTAKDGLVNAKFQLTLSDFSIDMPKYLGITVANTVDVQVELPLRKE